MIVKRLQITANECGVNMHTDTNTFMVYSPAICYRPGHPMQKTPLESLIDAHFKKTRHADPFLPDIEQEKRINQLYGVFQCLSILGLMDETDLEYSDDFLRCGGSVKELGFCDHSSR